MQGEDELALLEAIAEEEQGAGKEEEEGPSPQDQAMRDLVQRLRQWPPEQQQQQQEPAPAEQGRAGDAAASGASAAAAATAPAADAEPAGDDIEEEDPALPPIDVVEADYILEEQMGQLGGPTPPPGMQPPAPSRCGVCAASAGHCCMLVSSLVALPWLAGCVSVAAVCGFGWHVLHTLGQACTSPLHCSRACSLAEQGVTLIHFAGRRWRCWQSCRRARMWRK